MGVQYFGDDVQYCVDDQCQGCQFKGCWKDCQQVVEYWLVGSVGDVKIVMGQVDQVVLELYWQWLVEIQLMVNLVIG